MATMNDWVKEAEEQAKRYSDTLKQNNQYLIDQLTQSKQNALNQLQEQQNNTLYNLNTNKSTINSAAEENARQLDIARMLALKSNQQSLNRAGLGTQGIVGSQVNAINNNYNTNLASVLNDKTSALRDLEKSKNDALLQYNTNRLNMANEYGNNLANLQQSINDKALNQYNTVYSNYLNSKQQEYDNQQTEIARQEAIRQYNENLALQKAQLEYQKQQDAIANAQKWAQINAQKEKNNNQYSFDDENNSQESQSEAVKPQKTSCPTLSTRGATQWSEQNIFTNNTFNNGINIADLEAQLSEALKNNKITQADADKILRWFGL